MSITKEQFDRLPRYAQNEITRLRANLESSRRTAALIDAGKFDTFIRDVGDEGFRYAPLEVGHTVRFCLNGRVHSTNVGDDWIDARVHRTGYRSGRCVELMGASSISVFPQASNVVLIAMAGK